MEWLVAIAIAGPLALALPFFIARTKRQARGKKQFGGFGLAFEAGLSDFNPAKARALQIIEIRKEIGHADEGNQGEKLDAAEEGHGLPNDPL